MVGWVMVILYHTHCCLVLGKEPADDSEAVFFCKDFSLNKSFNAHFVRQCITVVSKKKKKKKFNY